MQIQLHTLQIFWALATGKASLVAGQGDITSLNEDSDCHDLWRSMNSEFRKEKRPPKSTAGDASFETSRRRRPLAAKNVVPAMLQLTVNDCGMGSLVLE
jgi:hypothetical protein